MRMESGGRGFFVVWARAIVWLRASYDGPWRLPLPRTSPPGCAHLSTIRAWQPRHPSIAQHKSASVSFFSNALQSSDVYRSPSRRLTNYLSYSMPLENVLRMNFRPPPTPSSSPKIPPSFHVRLMGERLQPRRWPFLHRSYIGSHRGI